MAYSEYIVYILSSDGLPMAGRVYYYDSTGTETGVTTIPTSGADVSSNSAWVDAVRLKVVADVSGFAEMMLDKTAMQLDNYVYLEKQRSFGFWLAVAAIGGLVLSRLIKF